MSEHSYTTFTLNNLLYGIDTIFVEEIFYLPEITPVPEVPNDIIGIINIRGNIVPIMDLNYRFGYQTTNNYQLTDSVIILRWLNLRVGILVNQVHDVRSILEQEITQEISHDQTMVREPEEKFVKGIADNNNQLIIILDIEKILNYIEEQEIDVSEDSLEEIEDKNNIVPLKVSQFFPNASLQEREILQNRANNLITLIQEEDNENLETIAIIKLQNEFLGIDVNIVQEFITSRKITPIPCSEEHILGNMNFRGEILTLIDITYFLNIPPMEIKNNSPVILITIDDLTCGIVVSEICEIFSFAPQNILDSSNSIQAVKENYSQGIIQYQDKMLTLLDLKEVFHTRELART